MRIGIIGAENSHTAAIAKLVNVEKSFKGCEVTHVWGETKEFAEKAAKEGAIPNIVRNPLEMLGKVDGIVVDHRHPKYHLPAARPFIEASVPVFIDKPFCYRASEGKEFLRLARRKKAPVTSFSVLPHYSGFKKFMKKLQDVGEIVSASSFGPCDLKSKWGGIFFYGIHQVDVMLHAFGYDVKSVLITKNKNSAQGLLFFKSGLIATMALIKEGSPGFGMSAVGKNGAFQIPLDSKKNPYYEGTKMFINMFKTGVEPLSWKQILKPVQVLEAMEKSVKSGKIERVAS